MKHTLRGSTLAETLVVMLVTGIVFLAAMEALTLVSRLVARRAAVLVEAGRQRDGIFRLGQLLTTADSIRSAEGGADAGECMHLYRAGGETTLTTRDSAAVFVAGEFRDTAPASCRAHAAPTLRCGGRYPRSRRRGPYAETPRAAARTGKLRTKNR